MFHHRFLCIWSFFDASVQECRSGGSGGYKQCHGMLHGNVSNALLALLDDGMSKYTALGAAFYFVLGALWHLSTGKQKSCQNDEREREAGHGQQDEDKGRRDGAKVKKDARGALRDTDKKRRVDVDVSYDLPGHVLAFARGLLPLMFVVDGFSREIGTIMSFNPSMRLIFAYLLSLFRSGLPLSLVSWLSWSIQILAVRYFPSQHALLLDYFVLVFGLSSLRFLRILEQENSRRDPAV